MKKLILMTLTVLSCGAAYALPIGNPSEASLYTTGLWWNDSCCQPCDPCFSWCDAFSVRIGFYGDYVFNRHMEVKNGNKSDIDDTEIFTNAGIVVLNICDWIDIFGTFGATDITIVTNSSSFSASTVVHQLNFDTAWSWSVGGRATIWECDCFAIGVEGQYFSTSPDLDNSLTYAAGTQVYFNNNNGAKYSEWQVGLGASYRWQTGCPGVAFVPYMGVKWAGSKLSLDNFTYTQYGTQILSDLENKKLWGYAVGLTATVNNAVGVTVEGRFADEKAVYVTSQFRF